MTKTEIDNVFLAEMNNMNESIPKLISRFKRFHLEPNIVISYCYEEIIKKQDKIKSKEDVKAFIYKFIKDNIMWEKSQLNQKESVNNITIDWQPNEEIDTIDDNLLDKLAIENWYNERRVICEMYRMQETDKYKCIIYDCFFHKGLIKGVALAKHLGVNKDYGCSYVKQLKLDLYNYYLAYKSKPITVYYKGI